MEQVISFTIFSFKLMQVYLGNSIRSYYVHKLKNNHKKNQKKFSTISNDLKTKIESLRSIHTRFSNFFDLKQSKQK